MLKRVSSLVCLLALLVCAAPRCEEAATLDAAVASAKKATEFLMKQQNEDGGFGKKATPNAMPGIISVALKALADSPDKLRDKNPQIAKSVKYLLDHQQPSGAIADAKGGLENYNTSTAIVALLAQENPAYKDNLEKAKKYVLSCQLDEETGMPLDNPAGQYGAFCYGSSKSGDLSNSSFSLEALEKLGVEKNSKAWKNAVIFMRRCQDNDETNDLKSMQGGENTGGYFYNPGKSEFGNIPGKDGKQLPKPYGNMTYVAIKGMIYAGVSKDDPSLQAAYKYMKNNYTVANHPGSKNDQGYYFYLDVFAKAFTAMQVKEVEIAGGKKVQWAKDLVEAIVKKQNADGSFANPEPRWMEGDPILSTSYALNALNMAIESLKK